MTHAALCLLSLIVPAADVAPDVTPSYQRHVSALLSKLGCNGGTCHGAVQGQNGFRLSLFAADADLDHVRLFREAAGRRLCLTDPAASPLLRKGTGQAAHQGGKRMEVGGFAYEVIRRWIAAGAPLDAPARVKELRVTPAEKVVKPDESYPLRVDAVFVDGSREDVTAYCSFSSLDDGVAVVDANGKVTARSAGEAAVIVRYRAQPALTQVFVPRPGGGRFPDVAAHNFIDAHVLAKLRRLNLPPAAACDDATFLRRARLDVTGELPTPSEVRAFLADTSSLKRTRKIDELLADPGHSSLWTLRFCDLLKAADYGVYADAMTLEADAPRFQAWVKARLRENLPYDQFVERILLATSREGRDMDAYAAELRTMMEGYAPGRPDLDLYGKRKTLDLFWQRRGSDGVGGAMQVAHAFLGLRLECAQCHRHPHDVWQQEDLLDFSNFFMRVRKVGFQGENEKRFPDAAAYYKRFNDEGKKLEADVKKRKDEAKKLDDEARMAKTAESKMRAETFRQEVAAQERRAKLLPEVARRLLQAEVRLLPDAPPAKVSSPLGTKESKTFRLLGDSEPMSVGKGDDPRAAVVAWMRRPDNPFFARSIVNRVWAHYFGRGIVDPPDHLSPFNPATHPALLRELGDGFVRNGYDLRWLHRVILSSRTYQQQTTSGATPAERANYASFTPRRLPAEVLLDALNAATGTSEKMDMKYNHWPDEMKAVEIPFAPKNAFVTFALEQFGRPRRNAAVQCDCEREGGVSVLQVLTLANHPRVWEKVRDADGSVARLAKSTGDDAKKIDELFLISVSRSPSAAEAKACEAYLREAQTREKGLQGLLWALVNTREFLLQH